MGLSSGWTGKLLEGEEKWTACEQDFVGWLPLFLTDLALGSKGSQDWWVGAQAVELAAML